MSVVTKESNPELYNALFPENEIKEILDKLAKKSSIYKAQISRGTSFNTDEYEASLLLDYITNLQEENEYNNYCNEELRKKITNLEYKIKLLEGDDNE